MTVQLPAWWRDVRWCESSQRSEVQCRRCRSMFWLKALELIRWPGCPACLGWMRWSDTPPAEGST